MVPFGFFQFEWQIPEYRAVFEALARYVELVQYDVRGNGLSERNATDFSMAGMLRDLDAVVRRANLEHFALFGLFNGAPIALAYAAAHPERVTHLVLWAAFARGQLGAVRSTDAGAVEPHRARLESLYRDCRLGLDGLAPG